MFYLYELLAEFKKSDESRQLTESEQSTLISKVLSADLQVLHFLGIWKKIEPPTSFALNCIHISGFILVRLTMIWVTYNFLIGHPLHAYFHMDDYLDLCEDLAYIFSCLLTLFKTNALLQTDRMQSLAASLKGVFSFQPADDDYCRLLLMRSGKICGFLSMASPLFVFFVVCLNVIPSEETWSSRKLHFDNVWLPFNVSAPFVFEIYVGGFSLVAISTYVIANIADMFITISLIHTIIQLKVLAQKLRKLKETAARKVIERVCNNSKADLVDASIENRILDSLTETELSINEEMKYLLSECVDHHVALIRFVDEFVALFDHVFLVQIMCNLLATVLQTAYATRADWSDPRSVALQQVSLTLVTQLYLLCWLADKVNETSSEIKEAIYSSDWTGSPETFKRSMRIMISMSNQPITIKAAGFIPLSVETFSSVMQTAYSYYMVIKR